MSFYQPYHMREVDNIPKTDKCLILDIDETLVSTFDPVDTRYLLTSGLPRDTSRFDVRHRLYTINVKGYAPLWGIKRYELDEFIAFCNKYFAMVNVWSAGSYDYVHAMCDIIFEGLKRPTIIYTNEDCDKANGYIYKPLVKMLQDPRNKGLMTHRNTLILDDKAYTFSKNIGNGILVPAYQPRITADELAYPDTALSIFKDWLLQPYIIGTPDVTTIVKNIYTQV